ncbi:acyltransferase [Tannockella kyphosi]|uniref:acyltransferase n=1 Tax=Tannockella kyphosi TaxID=2899121 RepID=UPI002012D48E|nr:acyltransferase [Tannockella kyphosi]
MKKILFILNMYTNFYNVLNLKRKKVSYSDNLNINGKLSLHGNGKIYIGNNVTIHSDCRINPIGGLTKTFLRAEGSAILKIGNNVGISHSAITAFENITIEDNVLIGSGCKIYDTDFHSLDYNERINENDTGAKCRSVLIRNGVFIGAHCIILKGVTIGEKSIIGAGSVVTRSVPPYQVWAGNPAKFIKKVSV